MSREYDKHGLPVLPEGYFWSVRPNWATGTPYMNLMLEVNWLLFKTSYSVASEPMFRGTGSHQRTQAANIIMNRREGLGDYR